MEAVLASDVEDGDEDDSGFDVAEAVTGRPVRSCDASAAVGTFCTEVSMRIELIPILLVCCGAGDILAIVGFVSKRFDRGEFKKSFSLAYAVKRRVRQRYSECLVSRRALGGMDYLVGKEKGGLAGS